MKSADYFPEHIAIIMDGNRRWARSRTLDVLQGHNQGAQTLKTITRYVAEQGIGWLTVFAFSSENWKRSEREVGALLRLMKRFLMNETDQLVRENVRLRIIGDRTVFDPELQGLFEAVERNTQHNTGLNLNIAVNYGGRADIARAACKMAHDIAEADIPDGHIAAEDMLKSYLDTSELPDIDLLIRTGGEMRVSNFLLWELSYAELYFTSTCWPEFSASDIDAALSEFSRRNRRFGGDQTKTSAG